MKNNEEKEILTLKELAQKKITEYLVYDRTTDVLKLTIVDSENKESLVPLSDLIPELVIENFSIMQNIRVFHLLNNQLKTKTCLEKDNFELKDIQFENRNGSYSLSNIKIKFCKKIEVRGTMMFPAQTIQEEKVLFFIDNKSDPVDQDKHKREIMQLISKDNKEKIDALYNELNHTSQIDSAKKPYYGG